MPLFDRVAIVGVGLIGGSIGKGLRARQLASEVVGIGRRKASIERALAVGAIDRGTTRVPDGLADANAVIVATPVAGIVDAIRTAAFFAPKAILTDAGSTKAEICRELREPVSPDVAQLRPGPSRWVGSHPLAGDHRTGPEHARADLLEGRTVVITPEDDTAPGLVDKVTELWEALGAEVVLLAPDEHDRAIAATSHLPHLVASALAAATPEDWLQLAATGWGDATRIAAGDAELWTQIFTQNSAAVIDALRRFEHRLAALAAAIENDDRPALVEQLQDAKRIRDALGD